MIKDLLRNTGEMENNGGKYNNLAFIKKFFPHIPTPNISKTYITGVDNFVRTSPKYSIPGLLNSKRYVGPETIFELEAEYEKFNGICWI